MKVIFHPTCGMNIDIQLSTNARNVSPQFGPELVVYGFASVFRAEHYMHDVLRVGMRHVPHLRCSAFLYTTHPALTRWAKACRAYGAERNANCSFSSQRLRARLKYVAPPALELMMISSRMPVPGPTRKRYGLEGRPYASSGRSLPAARSFKARRRASSSAGGTPARA